MLPVQRKIIVDHERLTGQFFRRINSLELFKRFFEGLHLWEELELNEDSGNEEIFQAWQKLTAPQKVRADEDLHCINDIAREKGRYWLMAMAETAGIENYRDMTLPHLAMLLYLHDQFYFRQAYELFIIDKNERLKVFKGSSIPPFNPLAIDLDGFKRELRELLYKEAEGKQMRFEPYHRPEEKKWMLVIPREHYMKDFHEFDESGNIISRERRPLVETIIIYYYDKGILKLKAGRGKRASQVSGLFAQHILNIADERHFIHNDVVNLDPLKDKNFNFPLDINDDVLEVKLVGATYSLANDPDTSVRIKNKNTGVLDIIRELPEDIELTTAQIKFQFSWSKKSAKTAELSVPNHTNLDETGKDSHVEKILERWGLIDARIKPLEPPKKLEPQLYSHLQRGADAGPAGEYPAAVD